MKILQLKDININYDKNQVLRNISLDLYKNEIVSIMGRSGIGKTTLLSLINGFLYENGASYTGDVIFENKIVKDISSQKYRKNISTLFQDSKPFPLSIERNITYAMEFYEGKIENKDKRVDELLKSVNLYEELKDKKSQSAQELSGGQKQRLCIAKMLTTNPKILVFDEPCSSLDEGNIQVIEELIKKLSKKYCILFTTHNQAQAKRISDRIFFVDEKNIFES